jgi:hypothetical protein
MVEDTVESGRTETTTDHDTIRNWVEEHGSTAAQVIEPSGDNPGNLAIVPKDAEEESVREISWDEFFEIFEEENLAFVYQTNRDDPTERWFCKFVYREQELTEDVFDAESSGMTWSGGGQQSESLTGETASEVSEAEVVGESTLEEGEIAETEVTTSEVVEKEIVETDRIQSRVVASEIVEENTTDSSVIDRQLDHCEITNNDTVENEVLETRRVTNEIFEVHTVESKVVDSETVERDLSEGEAETGAADEPMVEDATADLEDSGLTHGTIVASEIVKSNLERGDLVEGDVLETEVVERRVLENEIEERILLRMEIATGESIDDRLVESEIVESEIVERDMTDRSSGTSTSDEEFESEAEDRDSGIGAAEMGADTETDTESTSSAGSVGTAVNVTEDDEGKSVVDTYGDQIGIVAEVRDGTLYVDPDPGLTEKITSSLGWGDTDDDTYPVEADEIEKINDDEVTISHSPETQ